MDYTKEQDFYLPLVIIMLEKYYIGICQTGNDKSRDYRLTKN